VLPDGEGERADLLVDRDGGVVNRFSPIVDAAVGAAVTAVGVAVVDAADLRPAVAGSSAPVPVAPVVSSAKSVDMAPAKSSQVTVWVSSAERPCGLIA